MSKLKIIANNYTIDLFIIVAAIIVVACSKNTQNIVINDAKSPEVNKDNSISTDNTANQFIKPKSRNGGVISVAAGLKHS